MKEITKPNLVTLLHKCTLISEFNSNAMSDNKVQPLNFLLNTNPDHLPTIGHKQTKYHKAMHNVKEGHKHVKDQTKPE